MVLICLYFVFASKPKPVVAPPTVVTDTITVVQDTTTVAPVATPKETPVKAVGQQKQPKVEEQHQPKAQPEARLLLMNLNNRPNLRKQRKKLRLTLWKLLGKQRRMVITRKHSIFINL